MVSDGSRVNVLNWELSEVVTVSEGLIVNLLIKWITIGQRFSRKKVTEGYRHLVNVGVKVSNGLRVNILHLKLSYGVTVSEGKTVNFSQNGLSYGGYGKKRFTAYTLSYYSGLR